MEIISYNPDNTVTLRLDNVEGALLTAATIGGWSTSARICSLQLRSGMPCVLGSRHDGYCYDKFGLRDPIEQQNAD